MKFVSKMSNHRIILRPGIQANPILGSEAIPTLYVQFRDGLASVDDEVLIEKMLKHRGIGRDFIKVEEGVADPYAHSRVPNEPVHVMSEIAYGQPINRSAPPIAPNVSPNVAKLIEDRAKEIAIQMLSEIAAESAAKPAAASVEKEEVLTSGKEEVLTPEEVSVADAPETTTAKKKAK